VYRGRTSVVIDHDKADEMIKLGGNASRTFTNASTLFGSDTLELESVMDERDRRDFDGASTPVPFGRGAGRVAVAPYSGSTARHALSRSYSVESNGSGKGGRGEMVEMDRLVIGRMADSNSGSRANLLGHAQPPVASSPMSDGEDMDDMMMMTSLSQTYRQQQPPSNQSVTYADSGDSHHYYHQQQQHQPVHYQHQPQYQQQQHQYQQQQQQPVQYQQHPQSQPQPQQHPQSQPQQGSNYPARNVPRWG
ncbi:hypothetical protein GGI06_006135, partial [Coemansia sp. S85]